MGLILKLMPRYGGIWMPGHRKIGLELINPDRILLEKIQLLQSLERSSRLGYMSINAPNPSLQLA